MRQEKEMIKLILDIAKQDEQILAVYMNGSRANPNAPKDIFQDYDIVYVVHETTPYIQNKHWIDQFGQRLIMQDVGAEETIEQQKEAYGWLMLFDDGNRIDLHIQTPTYMHQHIYEESFCVILLDKDSIIPNIPPTSDATFRVPRPNQIIFQATCNEFWWCLNNVAKGVWRQEYTYTLDMINMYVRPQLLTMLSWLAGTQTDFACNIGKAGKYLPQFIAKNTWHAYLDTFCGADEKLIPAIHTMMKLFDETAKTISKHLQLSYNKQESDHMKNFVYHVCQLPSDATNIL